MLAVLFGALSTAAVWGWVVASVRILARAYQRYQATYLDRATSDLREMFVFLEPAQVRVIGAAATCVAGLGFYASTNAIIAVLAMAGGFVLPGLAVNAYRARRLRRFDEQLPDVLTAMANALRAGLTLAQSIEAIVRETPAPLGQEFGLWLRELKLGVPADEALIHLERRVRSEALGLVVAALSVARHTGGNQAEMLETLAQTARARIRLEARVRSLTAQGRLQGWIVAAMPAVVGLAMDLIRPDLTRPMLAHPFGVALVSTLAGLEAIGLFLIRRIVQPRF